MASRSATRRRYLLAAGTAVTAMLAGCQSSSEPDDETTDTTSETAGETTTEDEADATTDEETTSEQDAEDLSEDESPDDGYPPEFEDQPDAIEFDPDSFRTVDHELSDGSTVEVPLVPLEVAHNLYARREARIVDTRDNPGYRISHVLGAVRSPAPGGDSDDPIRDWPESDPVITYCHCPTHLAVQRAANLLDDGFEEVYALAGGFQSWQVADHPTDGEGVSPSANSWTIEGETDGADAGGVAYVYHRPTHQVAGAEIDSDGTYSIEFSFESVSDSDSVTVGSPSYEVAGSLASFVETTVTGDDSDDSNALGRLLFARSR